MCTFNLHINYILKKKRGPTGVELHKSSLNFYVTSFVKQNSQLLTSTEDELKRYSKLYIAKPLKKDCSFEQSF